MVKEKFALVFDPKFCDYVVSCVQDAVGEDIKQDMHGLITRNSFPTRIWDLLYTNLFERKPIDSCIAGVTKRGPWQMVPVFERTQRVILTFMREERYEELRRNAHKRDKLHYLDCLVDILNPDLVAPTEQTKMFQAYSPDRDKKHMRQVVQKILSDLKVDEQEVRNHALVLFNSNDFGLLSIRLVVIDRNLNTVWEEKWNQYILIEASAVMDNADEYSVPANKPERGLKLSRKANERQERNIKTRSQTVSEELGDASSN